MLPFGLGRVPRTSVQFSARLLPVPPDVRPLGGGDQPPSACGRKFTRARVHDTVTRTPRWPWGVRTGSTTCGWPVVGAFTFPYLSAEWEVVFPEIAVSEEAALAQKNAPRELLTWAWPSLKTLDTFLLPH